MLDHVTRGGPRGRADAWPGTGTGGAAPESGRRSSGAAGVVPASGALRPRADPPDSWRGIFSSRMLSALAVSLIWRYLGAHVAIKHGSFGQGSLPQLVQHLYVCVCGRCARVQDDTDPWSQRKRARCGYRSVSAPSVTRGFDGARREQVIQYLLDVNYWLHSTYLQLRLSCVCVCVS